MAKVLDRVKNIFKKNPRPPNLPPGAYPQSVGNAETLGTITKPPYQTDDDDEEDIESLRNYNVPEQTRLKGQRRDTGQSDDVSPNRNSYGNPSPALSNPSNPQFRSPSSGFMTGLPPNNNFNNNNNMNTAPDLPSRPGFPFLSQTQNPTLTPTSNNPQPSFGGFPPGMNQNQSTSQPPPPPPNNPQMLFGGFPPPDMNSNQPPPPPPPASNNSQPSFGGSPFGMNFNQMQGSSNNNSQSPPNQLFPGMNTNQTSPPSTIPNQQSSFSPNDSNNLINPQQGSVSKLSSSFRNQSNNNNDDNVSRLELDYPIENVLIDANIPSAMAVKINDVVEQDRLGNAYRIHRYTFQPSEPQHISYGNNQHSHQRSDGNSFHGGTRHIREIHNNHRSSPNDDMNYYLKSNKQSRRRQQHQYQSETALNQYIDQLLHTPGSIVIQAQNYNDLQQILNQQLSHNQLLLPQQSIIPFQSNTNSYNGPVFHYTARALYNDPMRNY